MDRREETLTKCVEIIQKFGNIYIKLFLRICCSLAFFLAYHHPSHIDTYIYVEHENAIFICFMYIQVIPFFPQDIEYLIRSNFNK